MADVAGEEEVDGGRPPDDGAAHQGDHRGRDHHRAPEGRLGQPEDQETHPAQEALDHGDDDRAPQGGLDGDFRLPKNLFVVSLLPGGQLHQFGDEVVALQET